MLRTVRGYATRTHTTIDSKGEIIELEVEFGFEISPGGPGGAHEPPSGPDIDLDSVTVVNGDTIIEIPLSVSEEDLAKLIGEESLDSVYDSALEDAYLSDCAGRDC